jgi:tetratricopeptide (TPR) repeat protein
MKVLVFLIILASGSLLNIDKIRQINKLKKEAEMAFKNKNYEVAALRYQMLVNEFQVNDDKVYTNLAHAFFQLQNQDSARVYYNKVKNSRDASLRSIAWQQLGVIEFTAQKTKEALNAFKHAMLAMPENEEARHNYETLKRLMEQQQNQQQQQSGGGDQSKQDQKGQQNQQDKGEQSAEKQQKDETASQGEGEQKKGESETKEATDDKGKEEERENKQIQKSGSDKMQISKEQAQMLLDAMRSNEMQYIQQQQRRGTRKADRGKPDW